MPTIFNILGPLANPAQPSAQAVGCADPRLAGVMAQVLADRGTSALVFRGDDGLDELTPTTTSQVWVVRDGAVTREQVAPEDVGLTRAEPDALRGGDRAHNAEVTRRFLAGEGGPVRDAVLLNAAAALVALDGAAGSASLPDALRAGLAPRRRVGGQRGGRRVRWPAGSRPASTSRPADRRTGCAVRPVKILWTPTHHPCGVSGAGASSSSLMPYAGGPA